MSLMRISSAQRALVQRGCIIPYNTFWNLVVNGIIPAETGQNGKPWVDPDTAFETLNRIGYKPRRHLSSKE